MPRLGALEPRRMSCCGDGSALLGAVRDVKMVPSSVCAPALLGTWRKPYFSLRQRCHFSCTEWVVLPKQALAVCPWVLCHQQLRSWGGFTATWCQTANPGCPVNVVIRSLCFCLLMVPQNSDNYRRHHLTSLPVCSVFFNTRSHWRSTEPDSKWTIAWLLPCDRAAGGVTRVAVPQAGS